MLIKKNRPFTLTLYLHFLCAILLSSIFSIGGWAEDAVISATTAISTTDLNALPTISINGRPVLTTEQDITLRKEAGLPESLKESRFRRIMSRRQEITPFAHNPARGDLNALVTVIEFIDPSCQQCLPYLQDLSRWIEKQEESVRHINIYMPVDQYNAANPAAFYSKVAQYQNQFWPYREALAALDIVSPEMYFRILMELDTPREEARLAARRHARQYYKELDADSMMARKLKLANPPHFFVNGVHVGEGGIPLEHLTDVLEFELLSKQIKREVAP